MKKSLLSFLTFTILIITNCKAQYANKSLREDFDYLYNSPAFINGVYGLFKQGKTPSDLIAYNNEESQCSRREFLNQIGDGNCYLMLALLNMYEVTLDKDYLIKFIQNANRILEFRRDIIEPNNEKPPRWDFNNIIYTC